MEKRSPPFCQLFGVWFKPQNVYVFLDIPFFFFVLEHTQVSQVSNYYIIIYTMRRNILLGRLSSTVS